MVIELKQADHLVARTKRDKGHGFIAFAIAAVAGAGLPVRLRCRSEQFSRTVRPKRSRSVKNGWPDRTVPGGRSRTCIPDGIPARIQMAFCRGRAHKKTLGLDKRCRKAVDHVIGEVLSFIQRMATASNPVLSLIRRRMSPTSKPISFWRFRSPGPAWPGTAPDLFFALGDVAIDAHQGRGCCRDYRGRGLSSSDTSPAGLPGLRPVLRS